MARHTRRRLPRDRQERGRARERAARQLEQLDQQANEVRELEAAARDARAKLLARILRRIDDRDLDITEIAKTTGISRQSIHRLVRSRNPSQPQATPEWVTGQRVAQESRGPGTIEEADGPRLVILFDNGERFELHARLARVKPL